MLPRPRLHYPDKPAFAFLQEAAERWPERTALRFEGESYSFRELDCLGNAFANALLSIGLAPGARVALIVGNRPEWIIANHGILLAGGAVVMPNPLWKEAELRHAMALARPDVVIAEGDALQHVDAIGVGRVRIQLDGSQRDGWHDFRKLIASASAQRPRIAQFLPTSEAALPFSSGTTGLPKAVRHTHATLTASVINWKSAARIQEDDRLLIFIPLFHIYALVNIACGFAAGATIHLRRRFDLDAVLATIAAEQITITFAAAPIAAAMASHSALERYDLSSLRYAMWGATPINSEIANQVTARTGLRWLHVYGSTEVPGCHCNPVEYPQQWRLDSPGHPVSDLELRIIDLATGADVVDGEAGEIIVRGPHRMAGYLPESANAEAFLPGGWFRTGDVGWREPDGWLHLTDRAKEMLKVSGFSVAPAEIERVLASHGAVADCAVFGVPDAMRGDLPKAAIVLRSGMHVEAAELITWVHDRLASYKQIHQVVFLDAIPRTASGKILRRELQAAHG